MIFDTTNIQKRVFRWVENRLGTMAMDLHEHAMNSAEENIELAQCCGVTEEECIKLVRHVYAKPAGDIYRELGGASLSLLGLSEAAGFVLSECADKQLEKLENTPREKLRKRQEENFVNDWGW